MLANKVIVDQGSNREHRLDYGHSLECRFLTQTILGDLQREGFKRKGKLRITFEDSIQNQFHKSFMFDG
jgi:hypothetical protein